MPDEVKTFSGSLVLDLGIWWRHVHTLYEIIDGMSPSSDRGPSDHWSVLNCNNPTGLFIFITDRD